MGVLVVCVGLGMLVLLLFGVVVGIGDGFLVSCLVGC